MDRDARIEPPIQTLYFRSGATTVLTFIVSGARAVSSFFILSPRPEVKNHVRIRYISNDINLYISIGIFVIYRGDLLQLDDSFFFVL